MVAMIMMRTLHRDISKYNQLETAEEAQEETGWKLVHGDVFRPPPSGSWLAVLVGTGVQLFGMTLVTMVFATLGFLSPANRGGLMTAVLLLFVFMGSFAGYFSARLYKTFKVRCSPLAGCWCKVGPALLTALFNVSCMCSPQAHFLGVSGVAHAAPS
jgi:transmembrane 9 superfamily protein 2/4